MNAETPSMPAWAAWRKAERSRLIAARLAMPANQRREFTRLIGAALDRLLPEVRGLVVAVYWPIRGEPDLRAWTGSLRERGARCALPVVVARGAPLLFREWRAGARLVPGVWNIPQPSDGETLVPQVVIAPLVGFSRDGYRLGYGGGYYDRTLAASPAHTLTIGVGYSAAALPAFEPQPHDIPMDVIVDDRAATRQRRQRPT